MGDNMGMEGTAVKYGIYSSVQSFNLTIKMFYHHSTLNYAIFHVTFMKNMLNQAHVNSANDQLETCSCVTDVLHGRSFIYLCIFLLETQ